MRTRGRPPYPDILTPREWEVLELLDKGRYNAGALATTIAPLERMLEAYEQVAYRTTVTAILTP